MKVDKVKTSVDLRIHSYLSVCLKWDKNLKDPGIITEVLEMIKERLVSHNDSAEKGTQPHKYFSVKAFWGLIWLEYCSLLTFCRSPRCTCTTRCACTDVSQGAGEMQGQLVTSVSYAELRDFAIAVCSFHIYMKYIHI